MARRLWKRAKVVQRHNTFDSWNSLIWTSFAPDLFSKFRISVEWTPPLILNEMYKNEDQ